VARLGPSFRQFDVTIDMSTSDKRHCMIGFKRLPQNSSMSRAQINALMAKLEWRTFIATDF
jgi:hypothetical protein